MTPSKQIPTPGSTAALKLGCTCPVLDNADGARSDGRGERLYTMVVGCPVHDAKKAPAFTKKQLDLLKLTKEWGIRRLSSQFMVRGIECHYHDCWRLIRDRAIEECGIDRGSNIRHYRITPLGIAALKAESGVSDVR